MCDCITNALYLMVILVSGDSLDIKELTYAIIINFILYFDWFLSTFIADTCTYLCIRCREVFIV